MSSTNPGGGVRLVAVAAVGAMASVAWGLGCGEAFSSGEGGGGQSATTSSHSTPTTTGSGGATSNTSSTTSAGAADAGEGGGPGECDDVLGDCAECARAACRAPYCGCFDDPACWALLGCTDGCGAGGSLDDCWRDCRAAHPESLVSHAEAVSCLSGECSTPTCAGLRDIGERELCILQQCTLMVTDCYLDPLCRAVGDCIVTCPDADWDECMAACAELLPDGGPDVTSGLLVCILAQCPAGDPWIDGGISDAAVADAEPA